MDFVPPEITLNGANPQSIEIGTAYTELGATAMDNIDGDITADISIDSSSVNTTIVGSYSVSYNVSDTAGNTAATQVRSVNVILTADNTPPVITLIGANPQSLTVGAAYTELGATALDNIDGDITADISIDSSGVNTNTVGSYSVVYTIIDSSNNTTSATRTVNVTSGTGATEPFITIWKTDNPGFTDDNQIFISTHSTAGIYTVDWGDGVIESANGDRTHTYPAPGIYTVKITGNFPQIYFNFGNSDAQKLLSVESWGNNAWTSMRRAFQGCSNLVINAIDVPDLSNVTDMSEMFRFASSFNQPIDNWDTSNITQMRFTFNGATSFNQSISNWDTSKVVDMTGMFAFTEAFNQPLDNWDTSSVTNMSSMFNRTTVFNQPINNWDTSSVTNMSEMFSGAIAFNQPIGNWNTISVINMRLMFSSTLVFNQPLDNWDTSSVENMKQMFLFSKVFNQAIENWNTSNVTDMSSMFNDAAAFNNAINNWNTGEVIDMSHMFTENTSFNQPITNWDTKNVMNMESMFSNATSFNQSVENWNTINVTRMSSMFNQASSFTNHDLSGWDVANVASNGHSNFFDGAGPGNIEPVWIP